MKDLFGYARVIAIGDIHGMYEKLTALMEKISFDPEEDMLVFLGDYIDRGPDSVSCLQYVYDLQHRNPDSVICLMGNHEVMLSSYLIEKRGIYNTLIGDYSESWLENGGFQTLQQLKETDAKKPATILKCHPANVKLQIGRISVKIGEKRGEARAVSVWGVVCEFNPFHNGHGALLSALRSRGAETIVAGHTPIQKIKKGTRSVKPLFLPNRVILCDTGAYMAGGKLSGVDVLSRKVWQT